MDFLNKPIVHITNGAYIIFTQNTLGLSHRYAFYMIVLNCTCYGITVCLLAIHFIYRYLALCKAHLMKLFTFPYTIIWIVFFLAISSDWWFSGVNFTTETAEIDQVIEKSIIKFYNLTRGQYIYAGNLYYRVDSTTGIKSLSWPDLFYMMNIVKIITICFSIVFFCGIKTYRTMQTYNFISKKTHDLQQQLFHALIVQTIIPTVTMFLPAGAVIILPIFEITLGSVESLILTIISTYPCFDPIVIIYFVKDYRNTVITFLTRWKNNDIVTQNKTMPSTNS
ncbi:unnamed protein product [Caenorhabditis angaria]|uniref:Seven TM Receptor n=1 Tax=Caenorhabditis angaria TaxID=860376 RepID=A0A9P1NA59_9PELO|nr:unnamed protein product [Caenorhabditis angaria]